MNAEILSDFKGEINGVYVRDETKYEFLTECIESLEKEYNLEINSKEITEFIGEELYNKTEDLYDEGNYSYEECNNHIREDLLYDLEFIKNLFNRLPNKIVI